MVCFYRVRTHVLKLLDKVHKLQNRSTLLELFLITRIYRLQKINFLKFKRFNALNIFDVYKKETGIFMDKCNSNMLPKSLDWLFINHQSSIL